MASLEVWPLYNWGFDRAKLAEQLDKFSSRSFLRKVAEQMKAIVAHDIEDTSEERRHIDDETRAADETSAEQILELNNKWALERQKIRAVYIKMRPIDLGLPPELDEYVQRGLKFLGGRELSFTSRTRGGMLDTVQRRSRTRRILDQEYTNGNKVPEDAGRDFFGLHWAVEVGPWTIELAKDPLNPRNVKLKSTHVRELDESWEKEEDRFSIGMTQASDEDLEQPSNIFDRPMQPYKIFKSNCQHSAATFAMMICRDHAAAFDEMFHCERRSTSFLDMAKVLSLLKSLEGWSDTDPRFLCRLIPVAVRTTAWKTFDPNGWESPNSIKNFFQNEQAQKLLRYYSKFEAAILASVGNTRANPRTVEDYIAHASHNMRLKGFEDLVDLAGEHIARGKA